MMAKIVTYLRKNHIAMMAVCCILPIVLIGIFAILGIKEWWVYPLALLVCIGSHLLMVIGGERKCH